MDNQDADNSLCNSAACEVRHACRRNPACPSAFKPDDYWQSRSEFEPEKGADCCGFVRLKFTPIDALTHEWGKDPEKAALMKTEEQ